MRLPEMVCEGDHAAANDLNEDCHCLLIKQMLQERTTEAAVDGWR